MSDATPRQHCCRRYARAWEIWFLVGFGWIADGAENAVLAFMLPALHNHPDESWRLTEEQLGLLSAFLNTGQALGACFWGVFADAVGRRKAFLGSVGLTALMGIASAFSPTLPVWCALRFATAFALGGNLPLAVTVASELLPEFVRDRALVGLHLFYELAALGSTALALVLLPSACKVDDEGVPTRCDWPSYLMIVGLPAGVVAIVASFRLPESPVWLANRGRDAEARAVLAQLGGEAPLLEAQSSSSSTGREHDDANATREVPPSVLPAPSTDEAVARWASSETSSSSTSSSSAAPAAGLTAAVRTAEDVEECMPAVDASTACGASGDGARGAGSTRMPLLALFGPRVWRSTVLAIGLWFFADSASGWWTWTPTIASMADVPAEGIYVSSLVNRVIASCSFVVATLAIGRLGPRRMLLGCYVGAIGTSALMTVWASHKRLLGSPSLIGVYGSFSFCFGMAWPVMYAHAPRMFPPAMRGAGFGLASAGAKVGELVTPLAVGTLLGIGPIAVGSFFTAMWGLASILLVLEWRLNDP